MTIIEAVSKRLSKLMSERGWSIYKLSRKTGLTPNGIQVILQMTNSDVKLKTLILLANAFDMRVCEFLDCEDFDYDKLDINF